MTSPTSKAHTPPPTGCAENWCEQAALHGRCCAEDDCKIAALRSANQEYEVANDSLASRNAELEAALRECEEPLEYAHETFNDTRFTDRHGMGPVFTKALRAVRAALNLNKGPKP